MVVCAHTVTVCVVDGEPLINMGLWKVCSSSFLRSETHTVVVCIVDVEPLPMMDGLAQQKVLGVFIILGLYLILKHHICAELNVKKKESTGQYKLN